MPLFAQNYEVIVALDTVSNCENSTHKLWFKGTLKDTIIRYRKTTVDSIVKNNKTLRNDTIFFIQHYKKVWAYIR